MRADRGTASLIGALALLLTIGLPAVAGRISTPALIAPQGLAEARMGNFELLGAVRLARTTVDGLRLVGLSGLAYDEDDDILYAVSDRGVLFHLRAHFDAGRLAWVDGLAAKPLLGANGRRLSPYRADAEGLALDRGRNGVPGDAELVVSFERTHRLERYDPQGRWLGRHPLSARLPPPSAFRTANQGMESVSHHPARGWVTGVEAPLETDPFRQVRLIGERRDWLLPLVDLPNASLVAIEFLPDGRLLTLERAHGLFYSPLISVLRVVPAAAFDAPGPLATQPIARLDSSDGWVVDNFEGLSRHRGMRFFMVSDDNESVLQATLIVYFEVTGPH